MLLRGIAAHRLTSAATFVLMLIVVAGSVLVVGFGRVAHVSRASAAVLVVVGAAAIAAQAAEAAARRAPEAALARLRGLHGVRLVLFMVSAQATVAVAGGVVGVGVGDLLADWAVRRWLTSAPAYRLGTEELAVAAIVTLVVLVTVLAASWGSLRRPLASALSDDRRPRGRSTAVVFLQVVLMAAAVVSVYEAQQSISARHDWVPLISPVLVGLAVGQVVVWVVAGLFAGLRRRPPRGPRLGWFLTVRRLARRAGSVETLRTVVAAGAVLGVAFCAVSAAAQWRSDRARLQAGAPVRYPVPQGALRAYLLARNADPQGRWLMPAALLTDSDPGGRRVFVDASRWDSVAAGFFAGSSVAGISRDVESLAAPAPRLASGSAFTVSVNTHGNVFVGLAFTVQYVSPDGQYGSATARVPVPRGPDIGPHGPKGPVTASGRIRGCRAGCVISSVGVVGLPWGRGDQLDVDVNAMHFGSTSLLARGAATVSQDNGQVAVTRRGPGLNMYAIGYEEDATILQFAPTRAVPALAGAATRFGNVDGVRAVEGLDGTLRPVRVAQTVAALPFVGTSGTLGDLSPMLDGSGAAIPGTRAYVLARADTPPSVLHRLTATGDVGPRQTYTGLLGALDATPRAQGTKLYVIVAVGSGLVALVFLCAVVLGQVGERRREAASLRVVGVGRKTASAAYRREALALGVAAFAGSAVAAWIACRGVLSRLPLVAGWRFAPRLDASPRPLLILLTAAGIGVLCGVLVWAGHSRVARSAPPRLLREAQR